MFSVKTWIDNKALLSYRKFLSLSTSERLNNTGKFTKEPVNDRHSFKLLSFNSRRTFQYQIYTLNEDMKNSASETINNGHLNLDHVGSSSRWVNDFDFWNNLRADDYYLSSFMCHFSA